MRIYRKSPNAFITRYNRVFTMKRQFFLFLSTYILAISITDSFQNNVKIPSWVHLFCSSKGSVKIILCILYLIIYVLQVAHLNIILSNAINRVAFLFSAFSWLSLAKLLYRASIVELFNSNQNLTPNDNWIKSA